MDSTEEIANNSPMKLIEPGTLRLDSMNRNNNARTMISSINIESKYLEYDLFEIKPMKRKREIEEKEWENEMNEPDNIPHELNDDTEIKTKFKWRIDENAIIFFRSKYLKHEQEIINNPTSVIERMRGDRKRRDR